MIRYINQSLLAMAAKCMKQVEFRHVKRILIPPAAAAHRGTAVHQAAERDAREILACGQRLSARELQDAASTAFHASVEKHGVYFSNAEAGNAPVVLAAAKEEAIRAAALYGTEVSPRIGKPIEIEKELVVEVEGLTYPLGGTLDLVHLAGGAHKITDLKTTAKRPDGALRTQSIQAPLYHLLAERALALDAAFEYEFLVVQKSKTENVTLPAMLGAQARQNVLERARILEAYLQTGCFMPAAPGSWWCSESWCGYWGLCPYGARQQLHVSLSTGA